MKCYLLVAAAMLASCSLGVAADLAPKARPAVASVDVPVASANGFYFGALFADTKTRGNVDAVEIKTAGPTAGMVIGYAMYGGSAMFAIEADGNYAWEHDAKACVVIMTCDMKPGWMLTQRAVFGMPLASLTGAPQSATVARNSQWPTALNVPSTLAAATAMPYITAGVAERRFSVCDMFTCAKGWSTGWVVGGGFRVPVSAGITADIGYLYANFGKDKDATNPLFKAGSEQIMRAALHYHL